MFTTDDIERDLLKSLALPVFESSRLFWEPKQYIHLPWLLAFSMVSIPVELEMV
jgi:hypothetical protein